MYRLTSRLLTVSCLLGLTQVLGCTTTETSDASDSSEEDGASDDTLPDEEDDHTGTKPPDAGKKPDAGGKSDGGKTDGGKTDAGKDGGASEDDAGDERPGWEPPVLGACGDGPLPWADEAQPTKADWSENAKVPITGWANRWGLQGQALIDSVRKGREHAVHYPVTVTASWMPQRLLEVVFKAEEQKQDLFVQLSAFLNPLSRHKDLADFERWLGLSAYPDCDGKGARSVPYPGGKRPDFAMGSTRVKIGEVDAITYSCAGCHASRLFGRSILGLQNRFSRANVGIEEARGVMGSVPAELAGAFYGANAAETQLLGKLQKGLANVGTRKPLVRGLDTSLAQVALSLAKRKKDPYATLDPATARAPRPDRLNQFPADSKPGNWWVLKYKNKWLLDGSVVSGDPVYTNLLWNEIGRGTDLVELEKWIGENPQVIADISAAVFAAEPVRFTEFFPAESIDLASAKRGKALFDANCASCHGTYEKGWEQSNAASLSVADRLATVTVRYHENTPVIDVGTDGLRNKGMESLVQLNDLSISKREGILIRPQTGYIPPPLVGIWARFPYFHNNSAPSLCAVLTRREERPVTYHAGEPNDPKTDFDEACNGYPTGDAVPAAWKKDPDALYDTRIPGLGNQGHDEGVFLKNGAEMYTPEQKRDIIEYLQTL